MSETGSVNLMRSFSSAARLLLARLPMDPRTCGGSFSTRYHEDFETPGISPRNAKPRKHKRQSPNFRRNARGRPQIWQRLCLREENLGFFASLTRFAVVAT
jgi:hypothetical protein